MSSGEEAEAQAQPPTSINPSLTSNARKCTHNSPPQNLKLHHLRQKKPIPNHNASPTPPPQPPSTPPPSPRPQPPTININSPLSPRPRPKHEHEHEYEHIRPQTPSHPPATRPSPPQRRRRRVERAIALLPRTVPDPAGALDPPASSVFRAAGTPGRSAPGCGGAGGDLLAVWARRAGKAETGTGPGPGGAGRGKAGAETEDAALVGVYG